MYVLDMCVCACQTQVRWSSSVSMCMCVFFVCTNARGHFVWVKIYALRGDCAGAGRLALVYVCTRHFKKKRQMKFQHKTENAY